ncbi:peptidyl-tRNA hydrolase [Emydomyces testavorans]|uniref:peptidyl-tRNA hydrolase n=1 Tax=Emydomyces testavorans TaxID=2070801 RepID=A0AAF0DHE0_9EURO|nr:peptidyl-tRNA hydrolase [Emydomyces testavorans]
MPSLFVASLGNPPPKYHKTLHSAGHILLRALADSLHASPFTPSPHLNSGLTTEAYLPRSQTKLTLWQSPTLMNVSGPTLVGAYKTWLAREGSAAVLRRGSSGGVAGTNKKKNKRPPPLSLVLVHDELELPRGELRIRRGGAEMSARGHNGVKSVVQSLVRAGLLSAVSGKKAAGGGGGGGGGGGEEETLLPPILLRVGIGIGRPASREPGTVADYVLREMRGSQYQETCAQAEPLVRMLEAEVVRIQS